ncbi:uncharacterized protein [Rutidosis leptorrhynchoides]|uniref:uncharacterized protein n=1 Tax=Rutidosis leptorrhynchoides TaxID=125765 RepID=UPI003A99BC89
MKILSLNVRGFGVKGKFGWVKGICLSERPFIAAFQETKCRHLEDQWVQNLWGSDEFGYVQMEATGNSGGLLLVWDTNRFAVSKAIGNKYFLAIRGNWLGSNHDSVIVNVYGSHNNADKKELWCSLDNLLREVDTSWVVCGDFNEVRFNSERLNCRLHRSRAARFNDFIARNNLIDIPVNGKRYTHISDDGTKFSRLDRFLVNDKFMSLWDDLSIVALDRSESDHCPLILRDKVIDYGPKPFKVFDEWFCKPGVELVIKEAWVKEVRGSRMDCLFRDRLKNVKQGLKSWSKVVFGGLDAEVKNLKEKAAVLEAKAETGNIRDSERLVWLETRK